MSPGDAAGLATLIAATAGAVVSVIDALKTRDVRRQIETRNGRTIGQIADDTADQVAAVEAKVDTSNELTIGQLGEAAETRRIKDKPLGERTTREARHVDSADERSTGA